MAKHTPGPWRPMQEPGARLLTVIARARKVASVETEEDARLIAKAPELRAALKAIIGNHCPNARLFCSTCSPARALLAEIDGEEPKP